LALHQLQARGPKGRDERLGEKEESFSRFGMGGVRAKDGREGGGPGENTNCVKGVEKGDGGNSGSGGGGGGECTVFSGPSEACLSQGWCLHDWEFCPP